MLIRYEMIERHAGASQFDPPLETLIRTTETDFVGDAVDAFNDFLRGVFGNDYAVELVSTPDDEEGA